MKKNKINDRFESNAKKMNVSPWEVDTYLDQAQILLDQGKFSEAKYCLKRALQINPNKKRDIQKCLKLLQKRKEIANQTELPQTAASAKSMRSVKPRDNHHKKLDKQKSRQMKSKQKNLDAFSSVFGVK